MRGKQPQKNKECPFPDEPRNILGKEGRELWKKRQKQGILPKNKKIFCWVSFPVIREGGNRDSVVGF